MSSDTATSGRPSTDARRDAGSPPVLAEPAQAYPTGAGPLSEPGPGTASPVREPVVEAILGELSRGPVTMPEMERRLGRRSLRYQFWQLERAGLVEEVPTEQPAGRSGILWRLAPASPPVSGISDWIRAAQGARTDEESDASN